MLTYAAGKVAAYSSESAEEEVLVVPIQDLRTLELSWVVPFTSAQDKYVCSRRMLTYADVC